MAARKFSRRQDRRPIGCTDRGDQTLKTLDVNPGMRMVSRSDLQNTILSVSAMRPEPNREALERQLQLCA